MSNPVYDITKALAVRVAKRLMDDHHSANVTRDLVIGMLRDENVHRPEHKLTSLMRVWFELDKDIYRHYATRVGMDCAFQLAEKEEHMAKLKNALQLLEILPYEDES